MERTLRNELLGALQPNGHGRARFLELEGRAAPADFASLASPGTAGEAAYRVWCPQPHLDR